MQQHTRADEVVDATPDRSAAHRSPAFSSATPLTPGGALALQRSIGNRQTARVIHGGGGTGRLLQRSPAIKILKFSAKWLERRSGKYVSGHIAKHARKMLGKAIHTVFKSPKDIRWLIQKTIEEAGDLAERNAGKDFVEEAGVKIERQSNGRWAVSKTFRSAIGTAGETVLRVILNANGRIVTAYPVQTLSVLGIAVGVFDDESARAADALAGVAAEYRKRQEAADSDLLGDPIEWIPILGDLYGGTLNENEDLALDQYKIVTSSVQALQQASQQNWTREQTTQVRALIESAVGAPYYLEDDEE